MDSIIEYVSKRPEIEGFTDICLLDAEVDSFEYLFSGVELPPSQTRRVLIDKSGGRVAGIIFVSELTVMFDSGRGWTQFQELVERWRAERGATSSITRMAMCLAYQEMIAIGPSVVPHIIRQLQSEDDEPDMWFWALKVLTHADPVLEQDRGNYRSMAKAWLDWWKWNSWEWQNVRYAW